MTEEARAARREVIDLNKQWRAAKPVRREYIRDLLARKTPPKAALRFAVTKILADPGGSAAARTASRQPAP
jgi:ParB family chromosome partitioning protein